MAVKGFHGRILEFLDLEMSDWYSTLDGFGAEIILLYLDLVVGSKFEKGKKKMFGSDTR